MGTLTLEITESESIKDYGMDQSDHLTNFAQAGPHTVGLLTTLARVIRI